MAGVARHERAWVRDAQAGSASAIEALFRAYWPQSFRAAYLVVHDEAAAEDIAQESFLAAIRRLETFDRRRPFGPWLHRIVINRAIDWLRARQLRAEAELEEAVAPRQQADLSDDTLVALAALTPEHRAVIVMRHLLGYTPGEIAELLNLPRGTVNSQAATRARHAEGPVAVMKLDLEQIPIPGADEAEQRAWQVVSRGYCRVSAAACARGGADGRC